MTSSESDISRDTMAAKCIAAEKWLSKVADNLHPIMNYLDYGRKRPIDKARIKIAILDTGYDPSSEYIQAYLHQGRRTRVREYKDFFEACDHIEPRDMSGHGTHGLGLLLRMTPHAEIFVARVGDSSTNVNADAVEEVGDRIRLHFG